jgi:hypothetical protein
LVDWLSALIGVLGTIGAYFLARIIDLILGHFFNKSFFGRIWRTIVKSIKKFQTRWHPITTCFNFRARFESSELKKVKEDLAFVLEELSEKHKGKINFSPLKWTEDDKVGSVNATFNEREYRIDMQIDTEFKEELESELSDNIKVSEVSESVAFSIEVNFPFKFIEQMLFSLNTLTNFLSEQLKENFAYVRFTKGLFTIAPIKADLTMDSWIEEKQFEVSLNLKAKENIAVNLYPKKAEIVFPTLQIDENVYEYLKATILNYYL